MGRLETWRKVARKVARKVEFRSIFHAPSQKFKILAIHNVLAHGKSYEHSFVKKSLYIIHYLYLPKKKVFHALSRKFEILAIPNVLAHWMSYEYDFVKKWDGHKLCLKSHAKSSFY
ncbi:hypothetical protein B296_00017901 [Ensete ventricosum]|uniref:Uncharacterized protein n=1 Tax=Ensete ventricosum TaxID=4639 RepID=A0A427A5R3_ENSVE|nr:hypothetical protein B296_00017901 [Ensete ventricosum]